MHQLPADIVTIDTLHLGRSGTIACYLIRGSVPILVDPGPAVCLPAVTAALATVGLTLADIGVEADEVGLANAGSSVVSSTPKPPKTAGEKVADEGEGGKKIAEYLVAQKII